LRKAKAFKVNHLSFGKFISKDLIKLFNVKYNLYQLSILFKAKLIE